MARPFLPKVHLEKGYTDKIVCIYPVWIIIYHIESKSVLKQGSHTKNMGQNKTFSRLFQYPTVVYLMPHTHVTNHNYKTLWKGLQIVPVDPWLYKCVLQMHKSVGSYVLASATKNALQSILNPNKDLPFIILD